jgi:Glycosyl transferase 4-like
VYCGSKLHKSDFGPAIVAKVGKIRGNPVICAAFRAVGRRKGLGFRVKLRYLQASIFAIGSPRNIADRNTMTPIFKRSVLIVVENLPVPLDRRVWLEATALQSAGYQVSVICPTGRGWDKDFEIIQDIRIYRYPAPPEAHSGAMAYAREYLGSMWHWFRLARVVWRDRPFDVIQGCNPPDLIFVLALWYRLWG